MSKSKFTRQVFSFIFLIAASTIVSAQEYAIIVNPENTSEIKTKELPRIFLSKVKSFRNGEKIIIYNQEYDSKARQDFEKIILQQSPQQLKAYWTKYLFTGRGTPPQSLSSDQEVIEKIEKEESAIGYIRQENVSAKVRVVATF